MRLKKSLKKAEAVYLQALEIREYLAKANPKIYERYVASTANNIGFLYKSWLENEANEEFKEKALSYVTKAEKALKNCPIIPYVQRQIEINRYLRDFFESVEFETLSLMQASSKQGVLSWELLFEQDFAGAEQAARAGLAVPESLHPSVQWIYTNLATALLFQGKYAEAKEIYTTYRDIPFDENKTFRFTFLEDLTALEKQGITHPDVAKIRVLLS